MLINAPGFFRTESEISSTNAPHADPFDGVDPSSATPPSAIR
jgi:hypothetical protein